MPAIKCPKCGGITDSNEPYCLNCGARLGKLYKLEKFFKTLFGDMDLGRIILFFIILIYSIHILLSIIHVQNKFEEYDKIKIIFTPNILVLNSLGLMDPYMILFQGEIWRLVTAMFVHLGILHLLFNSLALWYVVPIVENEYGKAKTIILFFLTGLLGNIASLFWKIGGGGASGAIFGLIGALVVFGFKRGGVYGKEIKTKMLFWALYGFLFGFIVNANQIAHAGGFLSGIILGPFFSWDKKRFIRTQNVLAFLCILIVVVCWVMALIYYKEDLLLYSSMTK